MSILFITNYCISKKRILYTVLVCSDLEASMSNNTDVRKLLDQQIPDQTSGLILTYTSVYYNIILQIQLFTMWTHNKGGGNLLEYLIYD